MELRTEPAQRAKEIPAWPDAMKIDSSLRASVAKVGILMPRAGCTPERYDTKYHTSPQARVR